MVKGAHALGVLGGKLDVVFLGGVEAAHDKAGGVCGTLLANVVDPGAVTRGAVLNRKI